MSKPFFSLLSLVFLTGLAHAQKKASPYPPEVPKPTYSEVPYGKHDRNVLDFWKAKSDSPAPVAFVIHGGGWKGGSKERLPRFADPNALLKAGISVVAINYRYVTSTEKPPVKAPLDDAARALQFVRSKAKEWNLDKKRIGAAGGSAGACSSLWLAFHDDLADPKSNDPVARESSRLSWRRNRSPNDLGSEANEGMDTKQQVRSPCLRSKELFGIPRQEG